MMAVAVATIAALAAPAVAHAAYKSSDPPDDGRVSSPPSEVTATFSEPLAGGSFLEITDPCGDRVDGGDVRIVGYDMSVSMSGAAAGRYTVFYRAHSTLDPHVTQGTFGFTAASGDSCAGDEGPSGQNSSGSASSGSASSGDGGSGSAAAQSSSGGSDSGDGSSDRVSSTEKGSDERQRSDGGKNRNRSATASGSGPGGTRGGRDDEVDLAAADEPQLEAPSVWEGIRLEPFLTGLLLAAIIGAAGGKMYAGIMGPRA